MHIGGYVARANTIAALEYVSRINQISHLGMCLAPVKLPFCLHYTTEHTQRLRHGRVGQLGPRYILIVTMNLQQSG